MRSIVLALAFSLILLSACGQKDATPSPTSAVPTTNDAATDIELLKGKQIVTLVTSMGDITLELDADAAPKTVTNFIQHAQDGYYNDLTFHRVMDGFMIQGGDPQGNGTGGDSIFGSSFEDEIDANDYKLDTTKISDVSTPEQLAELPEEMRGWTIKQFYESQCYKYDDTLDSLPMTRGAIAMANRGPNTNGSQFFIVQADETPWLEGRHTVFGRMTEGMDVLDAIAKVKTDENDKPVEAVTFSVEVAE